MVHDMHMRRSGPVDFLTFKPSKIFSTPGAVIRNAGISGYGDWSVGGLKWPSELKTDAKYWFSTDASELLPEQDCHMQPYSTAEHRTTNHA